MKSHEQERLNAELLDECKLSDARLVGELLDQGADIEFRDTSFGVADGPTPLMLAVRSGHENVVDILLEHKANVHAMGPYGSPLLFEAQTATMYRKLVANGADPRATSRTGDTVLMNAATFGNLELTRYLIGTGIALGAKNSRGLTALEMANERSQLEAARLLMEAGAPASEEEAGDLVTPTIGGWERAVKRSKDGHVTVTYLAYAHDVSMSIMLACYSRNKHVERDDNVFDDLAIHDTLDGIQSTQSIQKLNMKTVRRTPGAVYTERFCGADCRVRRERLVAANRAPYDIRVLKYSTKAYRIRLVMAEEGAQGNKPAQREAQIGWDRVLRSARLKDK